MPNPYEDFFNNKEEEPEKELPKETSDPIEFPDPRFPDNQKEALDEVLESVALFQTQAEGFSKLLSDTRAVDHKVNNNLTRLFLVSDDNHDQQSLVGEKEYHDLLKEKFCSIIVPMKELAKIHLATVRQFNRDIDKHYYSIEKLDSEVKKEKSLAINGINLQRQVLTDAAEDLEILKAALVATEKRIRKYINVGGVNNISSSEVAIINSAQEAMTSGRTHQFDYTLFDINMIDKTAISLGVYMKETTSRYLGKLLTAFEIKT